MDLNAVIAGKHDVYFMFPEGTIRANWFQFAPAEIELGCFDIAVEVLEWNPAVTSLIIELNEPATQTAVAAMNIEVHAKTSATIAGAGLTAGEAVYDGPRTVTNKYVSEAPGGAPSENGSYIVVELKHGFNNTLAQVDGCSAAYYPTRNFLLDLAYSVKLDGIALAQRNIIYEWEGLFDLVPNPVDGFTSQNYRMAAPGQYMGTGPDGGAPYPLVLWNQGGGETYLWNAAVGTGNEGSQLFANMGGTGWLKNAPEAAYILAPQRGAGVNEPGYSHQGVMAFINDLIDEGLVDPNRVYVAGPSAGGAETHTYLRTYPNGFAAAIPICAGAQNAEQVELFKRVPVWYVHADNDNPQNSLTSYNNLRNAGSTVARRTNFAAVADGIRPAAWGNTPRYQLGSVFGPHLVPSDDYVDAQGHQFRYYADGHWSWIMVLNNIKPSDAPVAPQYTTVGSENDTFMGWLFAQVRPPVPAPVTSLRIDALPITTVERGGEYKFNLILNENAAGDFVWTLGDTSFGSVDADGKVTIFDRTGNVRLTVTDILSGISHSITLRVAS